MLSDKQEDFLFTSYHSFNIASGAVSSGKTFVEILRWYKHIYDVPNGALLLMSGKTGEALYDNVIRDLLKIDMRGDIRYTISPQRLYVKSKKVEIACADASNEASWTRIQGKTVYGWLADEITNYPESFVKLAHKACRAEGKTWPKFWSCNPGHPLHFIKTDYIDNDKLDIKNWPFTLDDNPVLTEEYIQELKSSFSGVYYDRFIRGLWVLAEGLVYDEFDQDTHKIDPFPIPGHWTRFRALDYGYIHPFVCLWGAMDEDGRIYIYDEHYENRKLLNHHATMMGMRAGRISWTVADHDAQDNAEMRSLGVATKNAKKDIETGVKRVKARFIVQGDGKPRLYIFSNCKNLIKQLGLYSWDKKSGREKEEPKKKDDDGPDALRYMVMEVDSLYSSGGIGGSKKNQRRTTGHGFRKEKF